MFDFGSRRPERNAQTDSRQADLAEESKPSWFSDDSNAAIAPKYGRADFLARAWEIIDEARTQKSSTVFGLVGPWGSGKSSMLDWIRGQAAESDALQPWRVLTFNPWDYPDSSSLQLGFFATLQTSFGDSKFSAARTLISELGVAVAPFTAVTAAWGLFDPSKVVESGAKLLGGDRSADSARRKLVKTLEEQKTPVLIVIDDIDRISADELLLALKLIRQLGRLPYVHYLLSYDESTILDVLTRTNLIGNDELGRARDYMEKVVQVRFDVPRLRPSDVFALTNEALLALESAGHALRGPDRARFQEAYERFLSHRLSTPRALRRYFAQARILSPRFAEEVDLVDFLIVTWIRTFEPGVYALIQQHRSELIGMPTSGGMPPTNKAARESSVEAARIRWNHLLDQAGTRASDTGTTLAALAELFPRFAQATERPSAGGSTQRPHIGSEQYFDRYFTAGVPDGDFADSVAREAIADFERGAGRSSAAADGCTEGLSKNRVLTSSKIAAAAAAAEIVNPETFAWLAEIAEIDLTAPEPLESTYAIRRLIAQRLRELPADSVTSVIEAMSGGSRGALVATAVYWAADDSPDGSRPLLLSTDVRHAVTRAIRQLLDATGATATDMPWRIREALTGWNVIDSLGFASWIHEQARRYGDLEVLGYFVRLTVSFDKGAERARIEGFDLPEASHHFDLSQVAQRYAREIKTNVSSSTKLVDTPENRRSIVLAAIGREMRLRSATPAPGGQEPSDEPQDYEGDGD
ncbi:hypothetical protein B2G67_04260 [Microbacterium foliorum]|nr:hypothetical protein B2G67_04235 [Microbacterium foliorum]AQY00769.1 hypothetical protein B2G67_04260 [Microbacterium foliorum]